MDTRKALALLAYLAVTGEAQRRESVAALLWPEYDHSHALGALRRTLTSLRRALCDECLEINRETVDIAPGANLQFDLARFRRLVSMARTHLSQTSNTIHDCLDELVEASTLYRDHFMAGFSLRDSPEFDDWQFFQAEALRQELSWVLERLVHGYSELGDYETAIPYAHRWLAMDNLHEPAHRQLMQLFAWSGRRGAALHQYQECVRILDEELGVAPLEETTALYELIRENRLEPPPVIERLHGEPPVPSLSQPPGAVKSPPDGARPYPLVGRSEEWRALLQAYQAVGPDGRLVVLEGEAGIGKTRLAEDFLAQVQAGGGQVFSARCYEGETHLAFAPIVEGLRSLLKRRAGAPWHPALPDSALVESSRLVPELAGLRPGLGSPQPLEGPGAQNRFLEGLAQTILAAVSDGAPGVIFLDDLHWADEASLDLLTYLVRRLQGRPALLLIAWRGEDLPAEHRLRRLLAESQRSGRAGLLSLSRLSEATVSDLLQAVAPGQDSLHEFGRRLFQETEGLPFFIIEYLHLIGKAGENAGAQDWSMPGGVRDLLHSRLAQLSETARQLLQAAAVIGRAFDYEVLRSASGRSEEEGVAGMEELAARGLIREFRAPAGAAEGELQRPLFDFSHDKLRLLVYEEISLARRRLLHRRAAEVLLSRPRAEIPAVSAQIAHHYRQAGNAEAAAEYYLRAGRYARALFANTEALAHFGQALALGHPDRAWLNEAVGDLQVLQGEYNAARASYETAQALNSDQRSGLARLEHKLGDLHHRLGNWERAEAHFRSALEASEGVEGARVRAEIYSDWSRTMLHRGENDRALEFARRALALAEEAADDGALSQAHNMLGILSRNGGDLEAARRHLVESLQFAGSAGHPEARVAALNNLALVHAARDDYTEAVEAARGALEACLLTGDRHREAALHNNLADLYHALGQAELAMEHLRRAVVIFSEIGEEGGTANPEIWKLMEW